MGTHSSLPLTSSRFTDRKYQTSRPSTCQALLLLAIREFGMGEYFRHRTSQHFSQLV